ncbi:GTPase Era [Wolbachia endosymbiont of Pentidionis agamae]|uniref:GTPase Era n=1 Tax=Wolbachia endosymbiont of Pentidionis agamae TaxID=3110435 RepID=UPI002FD5EDF2
MQEKRCIFVTILGLPNAGKSTLVNNIIGKKITIVTPKVQTTRTHVRGITIYHNTQIVLVDSPGIFLAKTAFEKSLVRSAWSGVKENDVNLLLIDAASYFKRQDEIKAILSRLKYRCVLVINKIDLIEKPKFKRVHEHLCLLHKFENIFTISALKNDGISDLVHYLSEIAPTSPWLYPEDQVTDSSERFLSAEIIRERLFLNLREELPYSLSVVTEKFEEKEDKSLLIKQVILVLKDSHKKIIIGKNGSNIKKINIEARIELEKIFECKIHLFLFIKVHTWTKHLSPHQ